MPRGPGPRPRSHYPVGAPAVPCRVIALAPRDPPPLPPPLRHLHSCPPQETPPRGHHPPLHPLLSAGQVCPVTAQPQGEPVMGSTATGQSVVCGAESRVLGQDPHSQSRRGSTSATASEMRGPALHPAPTASRLRRDTVLSTSWSSPSKVISLLDHVLQPTPNKKILP